MGTSLDPARAAGQAREQAGLSQRQLARRAGTTQSALSRIESGLTDLTTRTLRSILAAAGFELRGGLELVPVLDPQLLDDVPGSWRCRPRSVCGQSRTWPGSLRPRVMAEVAPLDPERIVRTLARHGVRYVLIGASAARLHGFPRVTAAADITPSSDPDNLSRLAAALRELDARVYTEKG